MTDDDITLAEAMANKPDPTPAPGIDYRRLRERNAARHRAAIESGRCYQNGRPIVVHDTETSLRHGHGVLRCADEYR